MSVKNFLTWLNFLKDAFKQFKILASNLGSHHAAVLVGKKGGDYIFKDSYENQPTSQMPEGASCEFGCRLGWWIEFRNISSRSTDPKNDDSDDSSELSDSSDSFETSEENDYY